MNLNPSPQAIFKYETTIILYRCPKQFINRDKSELSCGRLKKINLPALTGHPLLNKRGH